MCVQAESIRDPRAEISYMDDAGAIYLPPFDTELQEITKVDYTNGNDEEQCSSRQTCEFTQDKTQNIVRDTIPKSQLSAQSLDKEIDELGQPKYVLLTLYGHFKELPCYTDQAGNFFIKGKLTMHKSQTYDSIEVGSFGTHLGFYADYYGAIYMHHKECKPEHLTKLHRESSPTRQESPPLPKVLRLYGHINHTQHIYVDDVGCKY